MSKIPRFQNIWSKSILGHYETILSYQLTKVNDNYKDFTGIYRKYTVDKKKRRKTTSALLPRADQ